MKKIKILSLVLALIFATLTCSGCGNMAIIDPGTFTFKKIHIDTHENSGCLTIEKWHDNERGIEVDTRECGALFLSEGTYILVEDKCPICDK